jgi:hypothetical protein
MSLKSKSLVSQHLGVLRARSLSEVADLDLVRAQSHCDFGNFASSQACFLIGKMG